MAVDKQLTPYEAALHHYGQWYEMLRFIEDVNERALDAQRLAIHALSAEMWLASSFRMQYLKDVIQELKKLQIC